MDEMQIMNVQGVDCYEKDGIAYLKLDAVARGLGFCRVAASGNEVIRWETVRRYLAELDVPTSWHEDSPLVGKDGLPDYIPENVFYRLAMKAQNDVAEKFQAKVADEIIPSIRKHGAYMIPDTLKAAILNPDYLLSIVTALKEETDKRKLLEQEAEVNKPKVLFAEAVDASENSILIGDLAKLLKQNGIDIGQNRLFTWMRNNGYLVKRRGEDYNSPTQKTMEAGWMEIKENTMEKPDGSIIVTKTPKVTGRGQRYFINKFLTEEKMS